MQQPPRFFLALEEYIDDSLSELAERLRRLPKKPVGEVTIAELCAVATHPNGLYFLFDEHDHPWYVGKATSRSFVERLPSHFDPRESSWFGTIPKKIQSVRGTSTFADAHAVGLKLRLAMLGIESKHTAMRLERLLRDFMQPELNRLGRRSAQGADKIAAVFTR